MRVGGTSLVLLRRAGSSLSAVFSYGRADGQAFVVKRETGGTVSRLNVILNWKE